MSVSHRAHHNLRRSDWDDLNGLRRNLREQFDELASSRWFFGFRAEVNSTALKDTGGYSAFHTSQPGSYFGRLSALAHQMQSLETALKPHDNGCGKLPTPRYPVFS